MDSNVTRIRNIVIQGGKVCNFAKRLYYLHLPYVLIPLFVEIITLITYLNIRCGNACLTDFRNLCDIINVGWKRKYNDK